MKKLIYLVAFGNKFYYELGQLTIDSLIKTGYDGDIIVLVETPYEFKGAKSVPMNIKGWKHKYDPHMCRARLHHFIDVSSYDVILYLDTDVIVLKNLDDVFNTIKANNCFTVFNAPTRLHNLWHIATMNKDDVIKFVNKKTPSICSGIYGLPSSIVKEVFDSWLSIFDEKIKHSELFVCDQNILCELLYTNKLEYKLFPIDWLFYPKYNKIESGKESLLHHCALSNFRAKYKYLEDRLGKINDYQKTK